MLVSVVLVGCTAVPMAPSVGVYPMKVSTPEHDQADDARCRELAAALRTVGARQAGRERQQWYDHTYTACMSASVHQVPGTPVR
jgi:hypothetical protein